MEYTLNFHRKPHRRRSRITVSPAINRGEEADAQGKATLTRCRNTEPYVCPSSLKIATALSSGTEYYYFMAINAAPVGFCTGKGVGSVSQDAHHSHHMNLPTISTRMD